MQPAALHRGGFGGGAGGGGAAAGGGEMGICTLHSFDP
jgi:hypothetical protein